ncbi:MAG: hypothetical protein ABJA76_02935 [Mucilaginibacter sp.]
MTTNKYISSTCTIVKNTVCKNGVMLFENPGADITAFLLSVYQHFHFSYPKFYKMDNLSKLGWLTAEILLKDDFERFNYEPEEIGVVLTNSNSSLDNDLKYLDTISDIPSPSVFVYTLPNIVIGEICIRNNFKGEHAFFIQEKFDGAFIGQQVNYLLDNDILQTCICGWADVLGQDYRATLFLVEKKKNEQALLFSPENMNGIFNTI